MKKKSSQKKSSPLEKGERGIPSPTAGKQSPSTAGKQSSSRADQSPTSSKRIPSPTAAKQSSPTSGKRESGKKDIHQSSTDPLATSSTDPLTTPSTAPQALQPEEILKRSVAASFRPLPEPYAPTITPLYVRASEPLLRQTIGKKRPVDGQLSLFENLTKGNQDLEKQTAKNNISEVGINLSVSERFALHGLQKLFSNRNYQNPIVFSIADYLNAYGVSKKKSKRGYFEYSAKGRAIALTALQSLEKPIFIHWKRVKDRKYWKKNSDGTLEKTYQVITTVEPILKIQRLYDNISEEELEQIISEGKATAAALDHTATTQARENSPRGKGELIAPTQARKNATHPKLTHFKVAASQTFLADNFVLIPDHIIQTIRNKYKKLSNHFMTFIILLCLSAKHQNFKPSYRLETLIDNLHLRELEKSRQKKRLLQMLLEDFKRAKEVGVLAGWSEELTAMGKQYHFAINQKVFWSK